jgi:hypothetical protein
LFTDVVASGSFRGSLDTKLATLALIGLCNSVISSRTLPRGLSIDEIVKEYARIFTEGVDAAGT